MKLLVTGGNGRIGTALVAMAARRGHDVLSLDSALPVTATRAAKAQVCDVTEMGEVMELMMNFRPDAVVHMAAWRNAGIVADHRTYADNVCGSYNVLSAAAAAGAQRAVFGSSAQVYGFEGQGPQVLPVTEDHPIRPLNAYALSKVAGEATAAHVSRTSGTRVASFRIMGARPAADMPAEAAAMAADMRKERFLLWTRIDTRDVAAACIAAVECTGLEPGPYNIAGAATLAAEPTRDLIAAHCPSLDPGLAPAGNASPMSCEKARRVFGFDPTLAHVQEAVS